MFTLDIFASGNVVVYRGNSFTPTEKLTKEEKHFILDKVQEEFFGEYSEAKPKDYALSAKADYWNGVHDGVIAGAKWDREQMMNGAIKGEVIIYDGLWQIHAPDLDTVLRKMDEGDKVRIIIVKE